MTDPAMPFEKLNSLPASAVILDASGTIVAVNDAWKEFAERNGLRLPGFAIGANYLQYCSSADALSRRFVKELKSLLAGRLGLLTYIYPCHSPTEQHWFSLIGLPLSLEKPAGVALLHVDLTGMLPRAAALPNGRRERKALIGPAALDAITGAVERTVSETLASQLNTLIAAPPAEAPLQPEASAGKEESALARAGLSRRQLQVLQLLGEGKSNKEVARALLLSPHTVKLHVSAILQRLKLNSRTHAALLASRLSQENWTALTGGDICTWKKNSTAA